MHEEPRPEVASETDPTTDRDQAASESDLGTELSAEVPEVDAGSVDRSFTTGDVPSEDRIAEPSPPRAEIPESRDALLGAIHALGDSLSQQLSVLRGSIDRELRAEAAREKVVDRLHAELQEYKQDLLLSMLRPIFLDLIQLHDDIGKALEAPTGEASTCQDALAGEQESEVTVEPDADRLLALLEGIRQGVEDILYRQGVEPFSTEDDVFDARRQRAVATSPTEDLQRVRTVASRLRKGFRSGDRLIRPEIVSVYAARRDHP